MGDLGFDFLSTSSTPSLSFDISWIFWVLTKFALLAHSCSLLWGKISHKPKKTLTMVFPTRFQTKIYNLHFYWDFCMLLIILKYHAKIKVSNPINSRPLEAVKLLIIILVSLFIGKILNNWLYRLLVRIRSSVNGVLQYFRKQKLWTFSFLISFYYWNIGWKAVTEFVIATYDSL